MAFGKKNTSSDEDKILQRYTELLAQAKDLAGEIDPMKATVLAIVKRRGGDVFINGMNLKIASKPVWEYGDELKKLMEKFEGQNALLKTKQKLARENGDATKVSEGEYVVCKTASEK